MPKAKEIPPDSLLSHGFHCLDSLDKKRPTDLANAKYAKELAAARKRTDELRDSYGGKFDLQRILDFRKNRGRKK